MVPSSRLGSQSDLLCDLRSGSASLAPSAFFSHEEGVSLINPRHVEPHHPLPFAFQAPQGPDEYKQEVSRKWFGNGGFFSVSGKSVSVELPSPFYRRGKNAQRSFLDVQRFSNCNLACGHSASTAVEGVRWGASPCWEPEQALASLKPSPWIKR